MSLTLAAPGIDIEKSKELVKASALEIVKDIRDFSVFQKDLWQRVPWLALEADGRTGFLDKYSCAYDSGFWQLDGSIKNGHYQIYIDLATGELIDAASVSGMPLNLRDQEIVISPKENGRKLAREEGILGLAFHLNELDASMIISDLEREAQKPYGSYYKPHAQEEWRNDLREKFGLEEVYTRKSK